MLNEWADAVYQIETEKRRLELIRYLSAQPRYEAAASLLRENCNRLGIPSTTDQILAAIAWLKELELITVRTAAGAPIARVTAAGREIAEGFRSVPGIARPDP